MRREGEDALREREQGWVERLLPGTAASVIPVTFLPTLPFQVPN